MNIGRKLNVLCTFNLRPVSTGKLIYYMKYLADKIIFIQVEVSKKREAECNRLRKEIEELNAANDAAAASAKQKFNAQITEAQDEIENLKKVKAK